ncbi:hypothetical protein SAMN04487960_104160 [Marinobacter mobilis]|uniref:Uncharacterized protein n=1 Tax=Marinobacter mobilis TaxID=488533 RepID=A0A1H2WGG2_9GAMM|nr:hypothetical protein SAMN04487960_104160 [Marinobacter mobilis]
MGNGVLDAQRILRPCNHVIYINHNMKYVKSCVSDLCGCYRHKKANLDGAAQGVIKVGWMMRWGVSPDAAGGGQKAYSTVTLFARLRGWSTSVPLSTATW